MKLGLRGACLGFVAGLVSVTSASATEVVLWDAAFEDLTPGPTTDPASVPYTRASAATSIHPLIASMSASGFTSDKARIVTTTGGDVGLFLEGAATNGHASDSPWDAATWTGNPLAGSSTTQDAVTLDPANVAGCALHAVLANGYGRHDSATNFYAASAIGTLITAHHFVKGAPGATYASNAYDGAAGHGVTATLTGGWDHEAQTYTTAGRVRSVVVADGRDTATVSSTHLGGGAPAGARNYRSARHMIETGPRASSWISAASTRAGARCRLADLTTVVQGGRLCLEMTWVAPYAADALPWSARIWTIDANNYAEIDVTSRCLRVIVGGVAYWVSAPITWSRGDVIVLRLDAGNGPTTGSIKVGAGRVCAINDGRTLASLPASGTIDIACNGTANQLEGVHTRWRALGSSPSYSTLVVSSAAELVEALAGAGARSRILLREGTYRLASSLAITAANNGLAIAPYPGEAATIDGGEVITGTWSAADGSGVRSIAFSGHSMQAWVGGVACERARSGFDPAGWTWGGDGTVTAPSSAEAAKVGTDGYVVARRLWRTFKMRVVSRLGAVLTLHAGDYDDANTLDPMFSPNAVWYAEGAGYVGDAEGFFWHSQATDTLYVKPRAGQDLDADEVIAGNIERILDVSGTLDAPVQDVTISGITLAHTAWTEPDDYGASSLQASIMVRADRPTGYRKMPGGALGAEAAHRLVLSGCTITGIGSCAVSLEYGSQDCAVLDCSISDIAGGGIEVGDVVNFDALGNYDAHPTDARAVLARNVIANNMIRTIGVLYPSSHAIWGAYVSALTIARNDIDDTPYTPIGIGWGWGSEDPPGIGASGWPLGITPLPVTATPLGLNRVLANRITKFMRRLDDGGGVYFIAKNSNGGRTVVADNFIQDSTSPGGPNGSQIYIDQGGKGIDVRHNVFDLVQSNWAKYQGTVTPFVVDCTAIGNYADAGNYTGASNLPIVANTVGALGATALAIRDAAGRIAA